MDSLPAPAAARGATEVAKTCPKIPSLTAQHTRCGKAGCRCTAGRRHGPYHYLRWREGTTHRRCYVKAADVLAVRAILRRRQEARRRDRLDHMLDLMTWRQMARRIDDYEARLREQGEHP